MRIFDYLSSRYGFLDMYGNNSLRVKRVTLTAAEVKLLYTTPQTLVAAPGTGKFISIEKVVAFLDYSTAVFTGSNNLEIRETDGSGTKVTADLTYAFLNNGSDIVVETSGIEAQTTRLTTNKPIVVAVPSANPGGSTAASTLTFIVFYRIVKVS